jgi:hypothetical protein
MDKLSTNRLADLAQNATAEALLNLTCPACGGGVTIQFAPSGPRGKGAGALSVMCKECMWRVISDGIPNEPPWVQKLGRKVQTAQRKVSGRTIIDSALPQ